MHVVRAGSEVLGGVDVKLDAEATGGAFTLLELTLEPGGAASPHAHTREDEAIAVVEGRLTVEANGRSETLGAGDVVLLRRGVCHAFTNETNAPVRAHVITAPGGLERFFRDLAGGGDPATAAKRAGLTSS